MNPTELKYVWIKQDIKIYVQLFKIMFKSENIEGCVYSS